MGCGGFLPLAPSVGGSSRRVTWFDSLLMKEGGGGGRQKTSPDRSSEASADRNPAKVRVERPQRQQRSRREEPLARPQSRRSPGRKRSGEGGWRPGCEQQIVGLQEEEEVCECEEGVARRAAPSPLLARLCCRSSLVSVPVWFWFCRVMRLRCSS